MARNAARPGDEGAQTALYKALASLKNINEVRAFMQDLCTPAELEALADRWRVVPLVEAGVPYRDIHEQTAVSVTTVTRVARCLNAGSGGYRLALNRAKRRRNVTADSQVSA